MNDIIEEVKRQSALWGTDFDDKNTANDWVAYITRYVSDGAYAGRDSQYSVEKFRNNLIKSAAMCLSAIAAIDRGGPAPRHYENQV